MWTLAPALEKLREQVNAAAPGRSTASDGTIGDTAHARRKSDHNPDRADGDLVKALDLTHDPAHLDAHELADRLVEARDARISYVISRGRIASSYDHEDGPAWTWRDYDGDNPHTRHVHVSVLGGAPARSRKAWAGIKAAVTSTPPRPSRPVVRPELAPAFPLPRGWYFGPESGPRQSVSGTRSRRVDGKLGHDGLARWQARLARRGWSITPDGLYGPQTADVARAFQRDKGLDVDGLVGPATWAAAWSAPVT